jgi:spermidine synthase
LSIDISEEAGVRYLHFGSSWVQGAMRIARPWALELDYTREMMLPLLLRDPTGRAACCRSGWAPPR